MSFEQTSDPGLIIQILYQIYLDIFLPELQIF